MSRAPRLLLVLAVALVIQTVILDALPVFGARADLWIVLTVAGGLATGPDRGAAIGFVCGLIFDLTQNGPIGLGALIFTVAGFLVGSVQRSVVGPARWVPVLAAVVTTLAALTAYVALGVLLGEGDWLSPRMIPVVIMVTGVAAVLTTPAVRIMAWTEGESLGFPRPGSRSRSSGRSGRRQRSSRPRPRFRTRL
jgi:rod shape-determining protein MreD